MIVSTSISIVLSICSLNILSLQLLSKSFRDSQILQIFQIEMLTRDDDDSRNLEKDNCEKKFIFVDNWEDGQ